MTSCDDNLAIQLPVLLQSIADNLSDKDVHFYLFHTSVSKTNIELLDKLCKYYGMMHLHEVVIPNPEDYEVLTKAGGGWCKEAYYSFCAHELLPRDMERILYLDAGDVVINGKIDGFYFGDFEDCSLLVTPGRYKKKDNQLIVYDAEDLADKNALEGMVNGIFNSGSYVMNLEKMRREGYSMKDYQFLSRTLQEVLGKKEKAYVGDQGLLSVAFAGDIKYFGYPQVRNLWFMPFDFGVWYFDRMKELPGYDPRIIHFSGVRFKPWKGKYPIFLERFQDKSQLHPLSDLKLGQAEYYYLWHNSRHRNLRCRIWSGFHSL